MKVENAAGRKIETEIAGRTFKPFAGGKKYSYISKIASLTEALKKCDLNHGPDKPAIQSKCFAAPDGKEDHQYTGYQKPKARKSQRPGKPEPKFDPHKGC